MLKERGFFKGVNLGGWLSQCDYSEERLNNFIKEEDIAKISSWDLDHVRIPIDYNILENEDGTYKADGFARIDKALEWCRKYKLNAVLDLHKTAGFSFDFGEKESGFFDSEKLQERILVCLGGRIMEEVFFGEMISVEAMQDVTRAIEYAREILLLYGERFGEFSAEEYVQETLHSGGLAMLYGGWQKEQLASLSYALYEKERVAYKALENHMISLERPWKEEGKRFRRKYPRLLEGYSADSFSSALVLVEAEGRRNNIRKTLKQCGIEEVDGCDVQTAYQKLSEEKASYDLLIFDYEDFVYAGRLYSFLEELFDLIEQKQGKTLVCVPLGEYLKKLSGGVKITREGTREEHYKERQVTLADAVWWYIPDRDMTKDVKRELAQLPGRQKEIVEKNILQ